MAVIHFHHQRQNHHRPSSRLSRRAKHNFRRAQESSGLVHGMTLTGMGLVLLVGGIVAELAQATFVSFVLLFFSCPFLVFGGMLLALLGIESLFRHVMRIQHHCGRCRFYRPLDASYALGRCQADPRQRVMQRIDACTFFEYSERAMVRDRFAQQAAIEARRRGNHHVESSV